MTIKISIHFADPSGESPDHRAVIHGREVSYSAIAIGDLTDKIAETEAHLSRITGLVVKIETGEE